MMNYEDTDECCTKYVGSSLNASRRKQTCPADRKCGGGDDKNSCG